MVVFLAQRETSQLELSANTFGVWDYAAYQLPKARRVIHFLSVAEFVRDDIVGQFRRQKKNSVVDGNHAVF